MLRKLLKKIPKRVRKKKMVRVIKPLDFDEQFESAKIKKMVLPNGDEIHYKEIIEVGDTFIKFIDDNDRLVIKEWEKEREQKKEVNNTPEPLYQ